MVPGIALAAAVTAAGGDERRLPVTFVENRGQWLPPVRFVARDGGTTVLVHDRGFRLRLVAEEIVGTSCDGGTRVATGVRLEEVAISVEEAALDARAGGSGEQSARHHFLLGRDRSRWRTGVPGFAAARLAGVRPGIDLVLRATERGFEYDLELAPGARLDELVLRCDGARGLRLADDGALVVVTALGELRQSPPRAWFTAADGRRRAATVAFRPLGGLRFGFLAPPAAPDESLTIDPGLEWSTFLGGTDADRAFDLAVSDDGIVTVAGRGLSADLPATPGAFDESYNGTGTTPSAIGDVWVARFTRDGSALQWCTYLGGSDNDHVAELQVTAGGEAVVSGWTTSSDFPTTDGCYDDSYGGNGSGRNLGGDVYVTRLSSDGAALVGSTLLGGGDLEYTIGMALGADESVYVTGHVHSRDFPTTPGCWQPTTTDSSEIFVSRVSADCTQLLASTFFGGDEEEYSHGLAVAADGVVTVAGGTNSTDMPVTAGVVDAVYDGGDTDSHLLEGFVVRFDADLSTLIWMTYLGRGATDAVFGMQVAPDGSTILCGETRSADFPVTSGAFDTSHGGAFDAFVARLSPDATALHWCTFLGGEDDERAEGLQLEPSGNVVVAGRTRSTLFPTTLGAWDRTLGGGHDAWVARLSRDGARLLYSTYLGDAFFDHAHEVATDGTGAASVGGETGSATFPTTPGAFDTTYNTKNDAFVTRLDLLPAGTLKYGRSTPGCSGALAIGVDRMVQAGADFALTCEDGPPTGSGWLGLAFGRLDPPEPIAGIELFLDPGSGLFLLVPASTDALGYAELEIAVPPGLEGLVFTAQWFWLDPCGPQGITASHALEVTIQP